MKAKYYIYRNLHTGTFSVMLRGKVIDHPTSFKATGVEFRVREAGRDKVRETKRKGVHAFVVADSYESINKDTEGLIGVYYNPYECNTFVIDDEPILFSDIAYGIDNKVYVEVSDG